MIGDPIQLPTLSIGIFRFTMRNTSLVIQTLNLSLECFINNPLISMTNSSLSLNVNFFLYSMFEIKKNQLIAFFLLFNETGNYAKSPITATTDSRIFISHSSFYPKFSSDDLFVTFANLLDTNIVFDNFTIFLESTGATFHLAQIQVCNCTIKNSNFKYLFPILNIFI